MDPIHFDAFCRLLSLLWDNKEIFLWDVAQFGIPIQRQRNFFRGHEDTERVNVDSQYFPEGWGPLLGKNHLVIPLSPLLRTRSSDLYGIYRSSWTLYQPKGLVWHYGFLVLLLISALLLRILVVKPPPFLELWIAFINGLSRGKPSVADLDKLVQQLVPLFSCSTFEVPFRVVSPQEAVKLSGLATHWNRICNQRPSAEHLPTLFCDAL